MFLPRSKENLKRKGKMLHTHSGLIIIIIIKNSILQIFHPSNSFAPTLTLFLPFFISLSLSPPSFSSSLFLYVLLLFPSPPLSPPFCSLLNSFSSTPHPHPLSLLCLSPFLSLFLSLFPCFFLSFPDSFCLSLILSVFP